MKVGKGRSGIAYKVVLPVAALIVLLLLLQGIFLAGGVPSIEIRPGIAAIGRQTPIEAAVSEPGRGLTFVRIECIQDNNSSTILGKEYTAASQFFPWGSKTAADTLAGTAGLKIMPGLHEGTAVIRVTAGRASTWLRHPDPAVQEISLPVRLTPPTLQVTSTHTYVTRGGCELVVYKVGPTAVRDGVQAGAWRFPGYALPGGQPQDRFALFAVPYDMEELNVELVASDDAGNEAKKSFIDQFKPAAFKTDTLNIDDSFLAKVVPEIMAQSPEIQDRGSMVDNYIAINRELRDKNAQTLIALAKKSKPEFLWSRPFLMLPNGKVMATFGEKRTYLYKGKIIDHQTHLGYDFASTRQAAIPASNSGIVLFAGYLGIYGNAVVLDHGYGLMSIFGHMSSIAVKEGQKVSRGETIGRTGTTGLAGGDHLHFCTLLQGLPVNPIEWSDGHWIQDRIAKKLGPAFPSSK
jgi:murein DD-endopeptidase MepM/ murein hydrolase activator NlpD